MNATCITVLIGLGSNIEPLINIPKAINELSKVLSVVAISPFFLSRPVGYNNQNNFINGCLLALSDKSAYILKYELLREIEKKLGRKRTKNKNGPRSIDLDILLFGAEIINEKGLIIPDSNLFTQDYLLVPAQYVAGNMVNPLTGVQIKDYISSSESLKLIPLYHKPTKCDDVTGS